MGLSLRENQRPSSKKEISYEPRIQLYKSEATGNKALVRNPTPVEQWVMPVGADTYLPKVPETNCFPITTANFPLKTSYTPLEWYDHSMKRWESDKSFTRECWESYLRQREQNNLWRRLNWGKETIGYPVSVKRVLETEILTYDQLKSAQQFQSREACFSKKLMQQLKK